MGVGRDRSYLSVARYLAKKSTARNQHGAVIVRGGRVLGTGFNRDRNNPLVVSPEHIKKGCSVHAEIAAIKDAGGSVQGATIYVARVSKQGFDRDSKPCERCAEALREAGIRKIVYTRSPGVLAS